MQCTCSLHAVLLASKIALKEDLTFPECSQNMSTVGWLLMRKCKEVLQSSPTQQPCHCVQPKWHHPSVQVHASDPHRTPTSRVARCVQGLEPLPPWCTAQTRSDMSALPVMSSSLPGGRPAATADAHRYTGTPWGQVAALSCHTQQLSSVAC